ncbi:hypothetical protein EMMF5_005927 [Cystobasidiomycetes sp. EMM_F5]
MRNVLASSFAIAALVLSTTGLVAATPAASLSKRTDDQDVYTAQLLFIDSDDAPDKFWFTEKGKTKGLNVNLKPGGDGTITDGVWGYLGCFFKWPDSTTDYNYKWSSLKDGDPAGTISWAVQDLTGAIYDVVVNCVVSYSIAILGVAQFQYIGQRNSGASKVDDGSGNPLKGSNGMASNVALCTYIST